jgi:hypothetical protein
MVTFQISESLAPVVSGTLVYRREDFAFAFEGAAPALDVWVLVNDVELAFESESGRIVTASGYCPYHGWRTTALRVPASVRKAVVVAAERLPPPGAALCLSDQRWPVFVDPAKGWVCIGEPMLSGCGAEFAPGCVAMLQGRSLGALWLHPQALPPELRERTDANEAAR